MTAYCDHGTWKGSCSQEKHSAIRNGLNPFRVGIDPQTKKAVDPVAVAFEGFRWAVENVVTEPDGLYCRCCRTRYCTFEAI